MKCGFEEAQNHMLLLRTPEAFVASARLWVLRIVHYCLTPVLEAVFQPRGPAAHFSDSEHRLLNEFENVLLLVLQFVCCFLLPSRAELLLETGWIASVSCSRLLCQVRWHRVCSSPGSAHAPQMGHQSNFKLTPHWSRLRADQA